MGKLITLRPNNILKRRANPPHGTSGPLWKYSSIIKPSLKCEPENTFLWLVDRCCFIEGLLLKLYPHWGQLLVTCCGVYCRSKGWGWHIKLFKNGTRITMTDCKCGHGVNWYLSRTKSADVSGYGTNPFAKNPTYHCIFCLFTNYAI